MYCISYESLYKATWADHLLGHCHLWTKLVMYLYSFIYAWLCTSGVWPLELWLQHVSLSDWNVYMLCFISYRTVCKALSLVWSNFRRNSVRFVSKFLSSNGSSQWSLGTLQVVSEQDSTTLGCDLSHAFHIAV